MTAQARSIHTCMPTHALCFLPLSLCPHKPVYRPNTVHARSSLTTPSRQSRCLHKPSIPPFSPRAFSPCLPPPALPCPSRPPSLCVLTRNACVHFAETHATPAAQEAKDNEIHHLQSGSSCPDHTHVLAHKQARTRTLRPLTILKWH